MKLPPALRHAALALGYVAAMNLIVATAARLLL
jgi:hypothetical protein